MAASPAMAYNVSGIRMPPRVRATKRVCQPRARFDCAPVPDAPRCIIRPRGVGTGVLQERTKCRIVRYPDGAAGCRACYREPAHIALMVV
jgi:hypothetical protein